MHHTLVTLQDHSWRAGLQMKSRQTDIPTWFIRKFPFLLCVYQWFLVPVREIVLRPLYETCRKILLVNKYISATFFSSPRLGLWWTVHSSTAQYSILSKGIFTALCNLPAYKMVKLLISYIKLFWESSVEGAIEKLPRITPQTTGESTVLMMAWVSHD